MRWPAAFLKWFMRALEAMAHGVSQSSRRGQQFAAPRRDFV
jgi:hypothetical protein